MIFARQRPVVCLVTDRRRTAPGASSFAGQQQALLALIAAAADAGADLVHIREHDLSVRDLHSLAAAAVGITRGSGCRIVVGDRADVAIAAGADGVHLPAAGPPVARVRASVPRGWFVGRSAHSREELVLAGAADYAVFGTVFATDSKPGMPGQGIQGLADAVAHSQTPILAIGGITIERARACAAAGASGVAAISLFIPGVPGGIGPRRAVDLLRRAFNAD